MKEPQSPTDPELAAFLAGHLASTRMHEIRTWMASNPMNAQRVEAVRTVLGSTAEPAWNRDRMWSAVRGTMSRDGADRERGEGAAGEIPALPRAAVRRPVVQRVGTDPWRFARRLPLARIAAALIVFGAAAYSVASRRAASVPNADHVGAHDYSTRRGERATLRLSDGSRVTLAPESRLHIAAGFGDRVRSLALDGEAEFEIVHDSTRPFSVRAGAAVIRDIGTRFDLRAYPADSGTRVAVAEGAVTIGSAFADSTAAMPTGEGILVRRGEVGRLDAQGHAATAMIGSDAEFFGWTQGRLVFVRAPLRDVLASIGRWYDVDIRIPDASLAGRLVTADFSTQSPADMILALAQAVNASVTGSGGTFTLHAK